MDEASPLDIRSIIYNLVVKNSSVQELQFVLTEKETFRAEQINLGYVNYVFRVSSADGKQTFVVKHAEPTARANREFKLPQKRALLEYNALWWFNKVRRGCSPTPYGVDAESFTFAMEDLGKMDSLLSLLLQGNINVSTMLAVSEFVARIHNNTSRQRIQQEEWNKLEADFRDVGMTNTMFTLAFNGVKHESDTWNSFDENTIRVFRLLAGSPRAASRIAELEKAYVENKDCLVHRDLHSLAILMKGDRFAIHDMEFVGLGPRWADVVSLTVGFIVGYFHHRDTHTVSVLADMKAVFIAVIERYLAVAAFSPPEKDAFMSHLRYFTATYIFRFLIFNGFDALFSLTSKTKAKVMKNCLDQLNDEPRVMSALELSDIFFTNHDVGVDG